MRRLEHNDYEIIYQIKQGNQEALSLMFKKYSSFIYKKIHKFNLLYVGEDMYQEGLILLYNLCLKFDESKNKSFTRFFELSLERKYMSFITKSVRRQEIMEENASYISSQTQTTNAKSEYHELYLQEIAKILTKTENLVYTLRELKNYSIAYISENYNLDEKVIYNSLYRAKTKITKHFSI